MSTRDRLTYDHRLRELVWRTQDTSSVARLSIPRSTLDDWLRCPPTPLVTLDELDREAGELRAEVLRLRQRIAKLLALLRLLVRWSSLSAPAWSVSDSRRARTRPVCFARSITRDRSCRSG